MRKFLNVLFCITIINFTCLLCISFSLKEICVNTLSKSIVQDEISNSALNAIKIEFPSISYDDLQTIETNIDNSKQVKNITSKYFDDIISSINSGDKVTAPDIKEELISIIDENEEYIKSLGINYSNEDKEKIIDELVDNNTINKVYENVVNNVKENLTGEQTEIINTYELITSSGFRTFLIISIIILALLIVIVNKSLYKWLLSISISAFISGITIQIIIPAAINGVSAKLTNNLIGRTFTINTNSLSNYGYILFATAGILFIIYFIIDKLIKRKHEKYEY